MGGTRTCYRCRSSFTGEIVQCPNDGATLYAPEIVARIGMRMKDHEIQSVIGEGGMGVVYLAQHVVLEKPVAIKVLHDRFAGQTESVEQFILEAKAASRIRHPNIIDVTDIGVTEDGLVFLVMEYLEGDTLEDRLRRVGRLSVFDAVNVVSQVARGLGAAHQVGIVHRDLKPANIFLVRREGRRRVVQRVADDAGVRFKVEPEGSYDSVKLLDFGVAKFIDLGPSAVTRAGFVCGTPFYLSPEQAQSQPADVRSDIYSLGAVFYEMITGGVPFPGSSMLEVLNGHVSGPVVPPSQRVPDAAIDPRTDAVVLKCLAKEPAQRFSSADELCDALQSCASDRAFLRDAKRLLGARETDLGALADESEASRRPRRDSEHQSIGALEAQALEGLDDFSRDSPLSQTRRIRRDHTQKRGRLMLAIGVAVLTAFGLFTWLRTQGSVTQGTSTASLGRVSSTAPQAAPTPPAVSAPSTSAAPAAAPTVPAPSAAPASTRPSPPSTHTNEVVAAGKPHPASERSGRRPQPIAAAAPLPLPAPAPAEPEPPSPEPPTPTEPTATSPTEATAPSAPPTANAADEARALMRQAQEAWVKKYYAVAIDRARSALELSPNSSQAYQIITLCSCSLGQADEARQAAAHLDSAKRTIVRRLCARNGIEIEAE
jgi:serine/threonine protein kinase